MFAATAFAFPAGGVRMVAPRSAVRMDGMQYCESVYTPVRRRTRTVWVGKVPVGSEHPIALQTMTTTDTRDVEASVNQIIACADAGADIVRLTVQGMQEAKACALIKARLLERGYQTPLVADIHFAPKVALLVAESFDKIRINPGNFMDGRKTFEEKSYDDDTAYVKELEAMEELFTPLVLKCKEFGRAIRIGTNHGSLSARTLGRFGDTPAGMVESAFEFARICRKHDFHNFIFSMKASNPLVMAAAYRLLAAEMYKEGWDYPIHLGVTEAGEGEDGRIKSAIGIGSLLQVRRRLRSITPRQRPESATPSDAQLPSRARARVRHRSRAPAPPAHLLGRPRRTGSATPCASRSQRTPSSR
jgi:(E)-4-hydroxy-3-methylbut-2-enyl-diphosphate synthase